LGYFFKLIIILVLSLFGIIVFTLIKYPYLTVVGKYAKDPYAFLLEKRNPNSFDFLGTTHYSTYIDNYNLIKSSETAKCPFYLTPDEPDNRNILVSKNHILFDNDQKSHENQREYVKNLVPNESQTLSRLNIWFKENGDKDLNNQVNFENLMFFVLFSEKIDSLDIDMVLEYRARAIKLMFIPPFIRNTFMKKDLSRIDFIKKHYISKLSSMGYEKPHLTFELFWFNALPIYSLYQKSIEKLDEDSRLLTQIVKESKEEEFINEIFRLYPNPRSVPFKQNGKYFSANLFLANTDSSVFDNPLEIDLNRKNTNHLTFANPSNRNCLGQELTLNFLSFLIKKHIITKELL
jgi:hypothetical protein